MVAITEERAIEILNENSRFILEHLLKQTPMAIAIMNRQGFVLYSNRYFLKLIPSSSNPIGQNINNYIQNDLITYFDNAENKSSTAIDFNFIESSMSFKGLVIKNADLYTILAYPSHLAETELIISMSTMTNELTNLTRELNRKNTALEDANKTITKLVHIDPLTGLVNRRGLDKTLDKEISKSIRHSLPLCAIMVDLDHFKKVNDTYGHEAGDEVLVKVAETILNTVRKEDIAARFGGEEFIIILPNTPLDSTINLANRIRVAVEKLNFTSIATSITASFGVTEYKEKETHHHFIDRADKALYEAKETGRNKVVYHS